MAEQKEQLRLTFEINLDSPRAKDKIKITINQLAVLLQKLYQIDTHIEYSN